MPKRFMQNGMSRMQRVSLVCDREISALACFTANVSAYSATAPKLCMNGLAKPFVIWSYTPSSIEKIKNIAMRLSLKSVKARNPSTSTIERLFPSPFVTGQSGSVNA